jgi:predicted RNase H-like HicB family nuclease
VPQLPGVLAYGDSANDAMAKAQILALRVLAERLEHNETGPQAINAFHDSDEIGPKMLARIA